MISAIFPTRREYELVTSYIRSNLDATLAIGSHSRRSAPVSARFAFRSGGNFRIIHVTQFADAVYVLHAFEKKTQQTARRDIEIARHRLGELRRSLGSER
jgi:Gp49-like protein DUF891